MLVAGGGIKGGTHTKSHNSIGDVYFDRGRGFKNSDWQVVLDR
jgi:hypothetical protein